MTVKSKSVSLKNRLLSFWEMLFKIQIHEHIDCSLRPYTMLDMWSAIGFATSKMAFPAEIVTLWQGDGQDKLPANQRGAFVAKSRRQAAKLYSDWVSSFARKSLNNYLDAIGLHILPLMHDMGNLTRIVAERIEDAVKDGHIAIELRFAPQLHLGPTGTENTLDDVMKAAIAGIKDSPIPVKLIICALRHENGDMAERLADLAIKYRRYVGKFDLAASETTFPGVLKWWIPAAKRVKAAGVGLTIHLWETNEPTDEDLALLDEVGIDLLGHGVRGKRQGRRVIEVCLTSNVITAQYATFADHPVDDHYRHGVLVTINTDGTLLTQTTLSLEYQRIADTFDWSIGDFLAVNLVAVEASSFSATTKKRLVAKLRRQYKAIAASL
jgi:adenosine deaminase